MRRMMVAAAWLAVGCRGSEQAKPAPELARSIGSTRGSAPPASGGAIDAPADAAPQPPGLVDQMRALPRTPGDRTKAMALHRQALKVHAAKIYAESERLWSEAARTDPSWDWPFYNLACSTALQARPLDALAYLEMMRDRNPDLEMLRRIETDGDLQSIRSRPDFEALFVEIADGIHGRQKEPEDGCPGGMAQVPAGQFWMGSLDRVGGRDEQPRHLVYVSMYCIDRTEVTVKFYAACVVAGGCSADARGACRRDDRPDHPVNCVDWDQATAYCKWAGKRLPTEAEWEYAARGRDGRVYPWGNDPPDEQRLNMAADTTAPVGRFPKGASPFGVLDMAGNVEEWTADGYGEYSEQASFRAPETAPERTTRGSPRDDRCATRFHRQPAEQSDDLGIRCARGD